MFGTTRALFSPPACTVVSTAKRLDDGCAMGERRKTYEFLRMPSSGPAPALEKALQLVMFDRGMHEVCGDFSSPQGIDFELVRERKKITGREC